MSDLQPLKLVALSSEPDESLIPPLEQVVIYCKILSHICKVELQQLPKESFSVQSCPAPDHKDLDEGIARKGFDFLGRYMHGPSEIIVILFIHRIKEFSARHGFYPADVTKIVLIHELGHFVTHLGTISGLDWADFSTSEAAEKEVFAQESTHLFLRVAGYGHLVNVFDSMSHLCPKEYDAWRQAWNQRQKSKDGDFTGVLEDFRTKTRLKRPPAINREDSIDKEDI
jgi:hypothetical protein